MSTPAGWYADPAPESAPGTVRWWDGQRWTEQVQAAPVQLVKAGTAPVAHEQQPQQQLSPVGYQGPLAAPVPPVPLTHTPDGMALASPGKRLGAFLLDGLIVNVVSLAAVLIFFLVVFGGGALSGVFEDAGGEPPRAFFFVVGLGYLALIVAATLFGIWYYVLRVRKVGATFGKQLLGLRVRTFHTDGQLTWAQVWARYGIPALLNGLVGVTFFVDVLWVLWDKHSQTLHDKLVGTVVVDTSAPRVPPDHPGVQYARAFPASRGWMADGPNPQTPADYAR